MQITGQEDSVCPSEAATEYFFVLLMGCSELHGGYYLDFSYFRA